MSNKLVTTYAKVWVVCLVCAIYLIFGGTSQIDDLGKVIIWMISGLLLIYLVVAQVFRFGKDNGYSQDPIQPVRIRIGHIVLTYLFIALIFLIPVSTDLIPGGAKSEELQKVFGHLFASQDLRRPLSVSAYSTLSTVISTASILVSAVFVYRLVSAGQLLAEDLLLACSTFSLGLGVLQLIGPDMFYLPFDVLNRGFAVGVFSNVNHQAGLLVMAMPLLIWKLWLSVKGSSTIDPEGSLKRAFWGLLLLGHLVMVLLTGSRAGIGLLILVVILSLGALAFHTFQRARPASRSGAATSISIGVVIIGIFLVAIALFDPFGVVEASGLLGGERNKIVSESRLLAMAFLPYGSGPGTFMEAFRAYQDVENIGTNFVNRAHNDILEIVVELGIFGGAIILACLLWGANLLKRIFEKGLHRSSGLEMFCLLIAIISVALHSLIDYPLRNPLTLFLTLLLCFRVQDMAGGMSQARSR